MKMSRCRSLLAGALLTALALALSSALLGVASGTPLLQGTLTPTVFVYLPQIARQYPPPTAGPGSGHWAGATSRGHAVSFDVSPDGGQWSNFVLITDFAAPGCGVSYQEVTQTAPGPGDITGGQFGLSGGTFSFTGQLGSATTASGTYSFVSYPFVFNLPGPPFVCVFYLTQSGTWTASPSPVMPSPTASPTASATVTPTATRTETPAATPQASFTPTPTVTLSRTPTPTVTPSPTSTSLPAPLSGSWKGATSRAFPMEFEVSDGGAQWSTFKLKTDYVATTCNNATGTIETTAPGPGSIANNQMSFSGGGFAFTGQFTSAAAGAGTYAYTNFQIVIGLPFPPYVCIYSLNQSGTWTASVP